jgi:hypothetical protein
MPIRTVEILSYPHGVVPMKSTELCTALEIEARRLFADLVRERQPWRQSRRKDRAAAFLHCWQIAVGIASGELKLSPSEEFVRDLQRGIPTRVLEAHVGRDSHP